MAWKITRITEVTTIAVVVVLAGAYAWNAQTASSDDITGTIPRAAAAAPVTYRLPPIINAAASTAPAQPRAPQMNLAAHIIEPRETLKSIALRFNTRPADLATINRITADARLNPGESLLVPVYR